jgi:hypothetical protein
MTDPYRISAPAPTAGSAAGPDADPAAAPENRGLLRPVLWLVLIVSTAANVVTSSLGVHPLVAGSFGVVTLGCIATLIAHHYRRRR